MRPTICEKKLVNPVKKNFFWIHLSYTWIHLAIARCCQIHLKGLKSVPDRGFRAQVYPRSLQMYLFGKKIFMGGMVNPVISQPARMFVSLLSCHCILSLLLLLKLIWQTFIVYFLDNKNESTATIRLNIPFFKIQSSTIKFFITALFLNDLPSTSFDQKSLLFCFHSQLEITSKFDILSMLLLWSVATSFASQISQKYVPGRGNHKTVIYSVAY